jgi:hypothetical protein
MESGHCVVDGRSFSKGFHIMVEIETRRIELGILPNSLALGLLL